MGSKSKSDILMIPLMFQQIVLMPKFRSRGYVDFYHLVISLKNCIEVPCLRARWW